ncbi:MAG: hypothetical protein FJX20_16015 [Alphaproteobacteria bacterium]|nr:hypothetical protein [Alphaproteobacteria bacterium]
MTRSGDAVVLVTATKIDDRGGHRIFDTDADDVRAAATPDGGAIMVRSTSQTAARITGYRTS